MDSITLGKIAYVNSWPADRFVYRFIHSDHWTPLGSITNADLARIKYQLDNKLLCVEDELTKDGKPITYLCIRVKRNYRWEKSAFDRCFSTLFECAESPVPWQLHHNFQEDKMLQKFCTTELYEALRRRHQVLYVDPIDFELPERFLPTLRHYQRCTVNWLLRREKHPQRVPNFYVRLLPKMVLDAAIYVHMYCRQYVNEVADLAVLPPGGILADEMGLGKTIEMLALILLHPRPSDINATDTTPSIEDRTDIDDDCLPPKRRCVDAEQNLFCYCRKTANDNLIECTRCHRSQHRECVMHYNDSAANELYRCPKCWYEIMQERPLIETGATFVVSPQAISKQWLSELKRHVQPQLRVLLYVGVSENRGAWISPLQLAKYDVVLTDYHTLRGEFYHMNAESSRPRRHQSRYMRLHTPLPWLNWWRVCLDEAQMVESNTSQLAKLLHRLPAVNRWAVTGTPIQRSLDDLCPLLRFIGYGQACDRPDIWPTLVAEFLDKQRPPAVDQRCSDCGMSCGPRRGCGLIDDVLQLCMWRTCKTDEVIAELSLPAQSVQLHRIQLSNLERLFYSEQHTFCMATFEKALNGFTTTHLRDDGSALLSITPQILKILLDPLVKLRQCCNIPLVWDAHINRQQWNGIGANPITQQRQFMQPRELHAHLKAANILDCKSQLRSMASSYNGIASNYFLRKQYTDAVRYYEQTLRLATEYKNMPYHVDSLLQIHALHNLLQVHHTVAAPAKKKKNSKPANTAAAIMTISSKKVVQYEAELCELEAGYLAPYASQMQRAQLSYQSARDACDKQREQTVHPLPEFLADALIENDDDRSERETALLQRIYDECLSLFAEEPAVESTIGLLYRITGWYTKLEKAQDTVTTKLNDLKFYTEHVGARHQVEPSVWQEMRRLITDVYDCHLSHVREGKTLTASAKRQKVGGMCKLCELQTDMNRLECLVFKKTMDCETNMIEGLALPSAELTLVKSVCAFLKTTAPSLRRQIDAHLAALDCLQTVCKQLKKYWIEIEYTVKAYDELDMCKMRMMLHDEDTDDDDDTENDGRKRDGRPIWQIRASELNGNLEHQNAQLRYAQHQFRLKLARLKYIMHLEGDTDPDDCPICHTSDDERYVAMECGHHICLSCLITMRQLNGARDTISCAICRHCHYMDKIYYAIRNTHNVLDEETDKIPVIGNYSTKIIYITRLVLHLLQEHTSGRQLMEPKILIFSQWEPILKAISLAFVENKIQHRIRWSTQSIDEFKNPRMGITCLLMSLAHGSKGLNLIEANTVFLVEPILNPGEELQAIGRVHRFGQTKATSVHRFIVRNSIEENIYDAVAKNASDQPNWEFTKLSLKDLRKLFQLQEIPEIA